MAAGLAVAQDCKLAAATASRHGDHEASAVPKFMTQRKVRSPCRWATVCALVILCIGVFVVDLAAFSRGVVSISEALLWVVDAGISVEVTVISAIVGLLLTRGRPDSTTAGSTAVSGKRPGNLSITGVASGRKHLGIDKAAGKFQATEDEVDPVDGGIAASYTSELCQDLERAAAAGDARHLGTLLKGLEALEAAGGHLDSAAYSLAIRSCAKVGELAACEHWVRSAERAGVAPSLCSYNTLLDTCAKADDAPACERWLRHMISIGLEVNVISYATAIYARARLGHVKEAEAWMERMVASNIEPDAVSYNSVIHANSMVGNAEGAERWLEKMVAGGLEASVASYTAVIDASAKRGDVARAERWLEHMLQVGVRPNVVTFSAMIDACAKSGNVQRAEHWHDRMTEYGIQPNAHSFSAMINACAKAPGAGDAAAAERWLDRSEQAGIRGDAVVYSSVIDACGKAGDAERALRVFRRMQASGVKPHIVAYAALARPFSYRGDWIKVESIAQSMAADGIQPNEYFVYAQLLAYGVARPRQPERAEACFRRALASGMAANDHVVVALARALGRCRCEELMRELCGGREVPLYQLGRRGSGSGHSRGGRARGAASED